MSQVKKAKLNQSLKALLNVNALIHILLAGVNFFFFFALSLAFAM